MNVCVYSSSKHIDPNTINSGTYMYFTTFFHQVLLITILTKWDFSENRVCYLMKSLSEYSKILIQTSLYKF